MPAQGSNAGYAEDELLASTTQVASGASSTIGGYGGANTLRIQLFNSAVSGTTPSLSVFVEDTLDEANWFGIATFSPITSAAVGQMVNVTAPFAARLRVRWVITGTAPSFTFGLLVASQSPAS